MLANYSRSIIQWSEPTRASRTGAHRGVIGRNGSSQGGHLPAAPQQPSHRPWERIHSPSHGLLHRHGPPWAAGVPRNYGTRDTKTGEIGILACLLGSGVLAQLRRWQGGCWWAAHPCSPLGSCTKPRRDAGSREPGAGWASG